MYKIHFFLHQHTEAYLTALISTLCIIYIYMSLESIEQIQCPCDQHKKSDSLHVHVKLNCVVNSILNFNLFFFVESKESNHHI